MTKGELSLVGYTIRPTVDYSDKWWTATAPDGWEFEGRGEQGAIEAATEHYNRQVELEHLRAVILCVDKAVLRVAAGRPKYAALQDVMVLVRGEADRIEREESQTEDK